MAKKYIADNFIKSGGTSAQYLMADGSVTTSSGGGNIGGSGTTNYVSRFSSSGSVTSSDIYNAGSGLVGINTTNPRNVANYSNLTLENVSGGTIHFRSSGSTDLGGLVGDNTMMAIRTLQPTIPITFQVNNSEKMRIDIAGNVAIGSTSASTKLTISDTGVGNATYKGDILILQNGNSQTTNNNGGLELKTDTSGLGYGKRIISGFDGGDDYDLHLQTRKNSLSWFTNFIVRGNGNVGVGTTTPAFKLTVSGDVASTTATGIAPRLILNQNAWRQWSISVGAQPSDPALIFKDESATLERARFSSAGNFLIGTTTDNSNKLRVNGNIYSDGTILANTGIGWGLSQNKNGIDFNAVIDGGFYELNDTSLNCPPITGEFSVLVERLATGNISQRVVNLNTGRVFTREYFIGSWGAWSEIVSNGVSGSGTTGFMTKWNSTSNIVNSIMYDTGSKVGIGSGVFPPLSTFNVFNTTVLSSTTGNLTRLNSIGGNAGGNDMVINEFLVRRATGSDWLTANVHNGIQVDNVYTGTTNSRTFWEREPLNGKQYFGSTNVKTLTIDTPNNRVGINNSSPNEALTVDGGSINVTASNPAIGFNTNDNFATGFGNAAHYGMSKIIDAGVGGAIVMTSGYFGQRWFTNGAERMRIDYAGDLVLGHTSSLLSTGNRRTLTINGTSSSLLVLGVGGSAKAYMFHDGTDMHMSAESGHMRFNTGGIERMRLEVNGRLLMGITSEISNFHRIQMNTTNTDSGGIFVNDTTTGNGQSPLYAGYLNNTTSTDGGGTAFYSQNAANTNGMSFRVSSSLTAKVTPFQFDYGGATKFQVNSGGTVTAENYLTNTGAALQKIVYKAVGPTGSFSLSLSPIIVYAITIPANSFSTNGDVLNLTMKSKKVGTGNQYTWRVYINNTNSLTGAVQLYDSGTVAAASIYQRMSRSLTLDGTNAIQMCTLTQITDLGVTSSAIIQKAFNPANTNYIIVTAFNIGAATDGFEFYDITITN